MFLCRSDFEQKAIKMYYGNLRGVSRMVGMNFTPSDQLVLKFNKVSHLLKSRRSNYILAISIRLTADCLVRIADIKSRKLSRHFICNCGRRD